MKTQLLGAGPNSFNLAAVRASAKAYLCLSVFLSNFEMQRALAWAATCVLYEQLC